MLGVTCERFRQALRLRRWSVCNTLEVLPLRLLIVGHGKPPSKTRLMLRRRHDDIVSANRIQISVDNQDHAADDRADLFEEIAPGSLVGRKKLSLGTRLPDAWQLRRP